VKVGIDGILPGVSRPSWSLPADGRGWTAVDSCATAVSLMLSVKGASASRRRQAIDRRSDSHVDAAACDHAVRRWLQHCIGAPMVAWLP
jgi:hypothetical protein